MEGNRHEKVAIALLAYVIGFSTAFIAFGVNKMGDEAVVITYKTEAAKEAKVADRMTIGLDTEGLYIINNGTKRLLSANKNGLSASVISATSLPGFHTRIIDARVSPNGNFAYFCEQIETGSTTCDPYVYSLAEDTLHPVAYGEDNYYPDVQKHIMIWHGDSILAFEDMYSVDPRTPWALQKYADVLEGDIEVDGALIERWSQ